MEKIGFTCAQAKKMNLVDFLASLGHFPTRIRNNDYWYLSPLRNEEEASFKVNRKGNIWFDHGIGKGGDLTSFGKLYFNCEIKELLGKLENSPGAASFFHQQNFSCTDKSSAKSSKIFIIETRKI